MMATTESRRWRCRACRAVGEVAVRAEASDDERFSFLMAAHAAKQPGCIGVPEIRGDRASAELPGGPRDWRLADLGAHWAEFVGHAIADVSRPLRVDGSTLVVAVDSSEARTLLESRAQFVVRALSRTVDGIAIKRLTVRLEPRDADR